MECCYPKLALKQTLMNSAFEFYIEHCGSMSHQGNNYEFLDVLLYSVIALEFIFVSSYFLQPFALAC